jgi:hypothetical protein
MKNILWVFVFAGILLSPMAVWAIDQNSSSSYPVSDMASLGVGLVNQNPSDAVPGEYVDLLFKLENFGRESASGVSVEIVPSYPFSLDQGVSATQELGTISAMQRNNDSFQVRYRLKVDKDAVNGVSKITLKYTYDSGNGVSEYENTFDIYVSNPRTDFEIVPQDSSDSTTTLAIANVGANTAYSTIVSIPQQDGFRTTGASSSILGSLNAGDYSVVSFQIVSMGGMNATGSGRTYQRNSSFVPGNFATGNRNLTVDISYTDALGIRRTVEKDIQLDLAAANRTAFYQRNQTNGAALAFTSSSGMTYIIIGIVGIVAIVAVIKIRARKKK